MALVATQGQTFSATAICLLVLEGYQATPGPGSGERTGCTPALTSHTAAVLRPPGRQGNRGAPALPPPGSEHKKPEGMATPGLWR